MGRLSGLAFANLEIPAETRYRQRPSGTSPIERRAPPQDLRLQTSTREPELLAVADDDGRRRWESMWFG